jgi:hypothetical protein
MSFDHRETALFLNSAHYIVGKIRGCLNIDAPPGEQVWYFSSVERPKIADHPGLFTGCIVECGKEKLCILGFAKIPACIIAQFPDVFKLPWVAFLCDPEQEYYQGVKHKRISKLSPTGETVDPNDLALKQHMRAVMEEKLEHLRSTLAQTEVSDGDTHEYEVETVEDSEPELEGNRPSRVRQVRHSLFVSGSR